MFGTIIHAVDIYNELRFQFAKEVGVLPEVVRVHFWLFERLGLSYLVQNNPDLLDCYSRILVGVK